MVVLTYFLRLVALILVTYTSGVCSARGIHNRNICMNHDVTYPSGGKLGDRGQVYHNLSQQASSYSPSGVDNTHCIMRFTLCPACRVNLTMLNNSFRGCHENYRRNIVNSNSKTCDSRCTYLYVYDPNYFNATMTYYFSGSHWQYVALSKRTVMGFCMSTYDMNTGRVDFNMTYLVEPLEYWYEGSSQDSVPKGTIRSVNFPAGYVRDSDTYLYMLQSPNNDDYIKISFNDWDLHIDSFIEFENANVGRVDGESRRPVVTSNTRWLRFRFATGTEYDPTVTYRPMGFKLEYEFISNRDDTDPRTDCGSYNLESTGGVLQFTGPSTPYRPVKYDCVWVVKRWPQYDKIFLKLIESTNYRSSGWSTPNRFDVYYGLSSAGDIFHSFPPLSLDTAKTGFKSDEGFYVRLRGTYYQDDQFKMAYASYDVLETQLTCTYGMFTCSNRRCIDRTLQCDGADHCGDDSDEDPALCPSSSTYPPSGTPFSLSISIVIPIVVSVFLVIVICLFVVFLRRCQQLQRRQNPRNSQVPSVSGRLARGRRTRRSQIRVTIQQEYEDSPPTYEEAIGTPHNMGYFNMAFMWSQPDIATGLVSPPPYAEVIGGEEEGSADNPASVQSGVASDTIQSNRGRERGDGQGPQTERRASTQLNQSVPSGMGLRRNSNTPCSGTNSLENRRSIGQQPLGVPMEVLYADTLERRNNNKLKRTVSPQISMTDERDKEIQRPHEAPSSGEMTEHVRGASLDDNTYSLAGRIHGSPSQSAPDLSAHAVASHPSTPQQVNRRYKDGKKKQRKHRHTSPLPAHQEGLSRDGNSGFVSERPHSIASTSTVLPPTPEATLTLGPNLSPSRRTADLPTRSTYMSMPEDLHMESPERQRCLPERQSASVEWLYSSPERLSSQGDQRRNTSRSPERPHGVITLAKRDHELQTTLNNERQNRVDTHPSSAGRDTRAGPTSPHRPRPNSGDRTGPINPGGQAGGPGGQTPGSSSIPGGGTRLSGTPGGHVGSRSRDVGGGSQMAADSAADRGGPAGCPVVSSNPGGRDRGGRGGRLDEEEEEYRDRLSQSSRHLHLFLSRSISDEDDMYV